MLAARLLNSPDLGSEDAFQAIHWQDDVSGVA